MLKVFQVKSLFFQNFESKDHINKGNMTPAFRNKSEEMVIVTVPNCDKEDGHPESASNTENGMVEEIAGEVMYSKD